MESLFNLLLQILPLPILIGIFIWIFSLCLFFLFIILVYILLDQSSSKLSELVSHEDKHLKSVFSCDSLSLISIEKTQKDIEDQLHSFYLKNLNYLKKESIPSLPLVKLRSLITNDNTKSIPNRSIIKDLNSLSNSFKAKNLHQSIDSLFSKDSLVQ